MEKVSFKERALRVVLSGVMVVGMTPIVMTAPSVTGVGQAQVALASETRSGTFGGCQWLLDNDGTLTIKPQSTPEPQSLAHEGEDYAAGQMPSVTQPNICPWFQYRESIKKVKFESGVKANSNMYLMFYGGGQQNFSALESIDLSGLDTSQVTDMHQTFADCPKLSEITWPDTLDTSKVTSMYSIFADDSSMSYSKRIGYIDKLLQKNNGTCTDWTNGLFQGCSDENIDLLGLPDTSKATDMREMFYKCTNLTTIERPQALETSNVTDMTMMFGQCQKLKTLDLSNFDTSKATNMQAMFANCESLESLDLSNFDTSEVTNMNAMFAVSSVLKTIKVGDKWSTSKVTDSYNMFFGCKALVGGAGTTYDPYHDDATYAHVDGGTSNPGYLTGSVAPQDAGIALATVFYQKILDRTPDAGGLANQAKALNDGTPIAEVALGFFNSDEYLSKSQTSAQTVNRMYLALLGREADAAGAADWTAHLDAGMSVRAVAAGFSQSPEYKAHFSNTGLNASAIGVTEARDVNMNVTGFVNRLYSKALNRSFDVAGINHWCEILLNGSSAADVAWGFFGSQEFAGFGYDGPTIVTKCYQVMLNREPESAEVIAYWNSRLSNEGLQTVVRGFCESPEFGNLCAQYGIRPI